MRLARPAAAAFVAAVVLAGCNDDGPNIESPSPTPPSSTTSSGGSSTSPSKTPEETATTQASALARKFFTLINDLAVDPQAPINRLNEVATGSALQVQISYLNQTRPQGIKAVGRFGVTAVKSKTVDLTNIATPSPGKAPTVTLTACTDSANYYLVDRDGKRIPAQDPHRYLIWQLTVVNHDYPNVATWRVAEARNEGADSCAAAQ